MSTISHSSSTQRLLALDVFRGWTIAFMIIVNTPGNGERSWAPLQHARWHGFTPTDLVFPSFLFIIGVSAFYSLRKFQGHATGEVLGRIWRRTAILFFIGMIMWYVPGLIAALLSGKLGTFVQEFVSNVRVLGVLGRLALCYGIGATLALRLSARALTFVGAGALLVYWGLLRWFGEGVDPYALETNAVLRLDLWLFGPNHLYHGESVAGKPFAFDPEGLLSTLPALVTFIIGFLAGRFLHRAPDRRWAISELFPVAFLLLAGGFLWDQWLGFPINKKLWTSSYTLFVGGMSLFLLAFAVWLVDVKGKGRYFNFFHVFGLNPLLAYLVSEMGVVVLQTITVPGADGAGTSQNAFSWLYAHTGAALAGDNGLGSFIFSLFYMLMCWLASWLCFRRGWIIKV